MAKKRRLNARQQRLAANAAKFVQPAIASFLRRNPDLRRLALTLDLESVALTAVCSAALTFNRQKSQPQTYFGTAIRHALFREVLNAQKRGRRFLATEEILDPQPNTHRSRQEAKAMRALRMLTAYERTLLEDRLIEQVTLEQLSLEQRCDPRTIAKRVARAIEKLREIVSDLP